MSSIYPHASYYGNSAFVRKGEPLGKITLTTQHETTTAVTPDSITLKCGR